MTIVIYIVNLSTNGTASQSSNYYWTEIKRNLTADLAITGGTTYELKSCAVTQANPKVYVAWWILTFPDVVYITDVLIYYRENSKFFFVETFQFSCLSLFV